MNATIRRAAVPLALLLGACAAPMQPVSVPPQLEPSASEKLMMVLAAKGAQIYECRAGKQAGASPEWMFVAPNAELLDARGQRVGHHGAGPFWQASDGSRVTGVVKERADAPTAGAIPWLLLATRSDGPEGAFSKVTSIQRVNTVAGLAPSAACTSQNLGAKARSDYTADYRLFTAR